MSRAASAFVYSTVACRVWWSVTESPSAFNLAHRAPHQNETTMTVVPIVHNVAAFCDHHRLLGILISILLAFSIVDDFDLGVKRTVEVAGVE